MRLFFIFFLIGSFSTKAQHTIAFYKPVDTINTVLFQNKTGYYSSNEKGGVVFKMLKIRAQKTGKIEILDVSNSSQNSLVYFNILDVAHWEINLSTIHLKDKGNKTIGQIYGIGSEDIVRLKTQFEDLQLQCSKEVALTHLRENIKANIDIQETTLRQSKNIEINVDASSIEIKNINYSGENTENVILNFPINGAVLSDKGELIYKNKVIKKTIENLKTKKTSVLYFYNSKDAGILIMAKDKKTYELIQNDINQLQNY